MISALIAMSLLGAQAMELRVDATNGQEIFGEHKFKVSVLANSTINQVEFYVGNDLRSTDTSTPYEFYLDTLGEDDGEIKVTFAAYTVEGESKKRQLTVVINNGVAKGAAYHVARATEYLQGSEWNKAITSCRIALKADPQNFDAMHAMARAQLGKSVLDMAQRYAEDAAALNPDDTAIKELLSAINLKRAFATVERPGDEGETMELIQNAFKEAIDNYQTALESKLDALSPPTKENLIQYADTAIRAKRYSLAVSALQSPYGDEPTNTALGNRLAFALLRQGRPLDALNTLHNMKRLEAIDAYGYALMAVILNESGDETGSDDAIKEAIFLDSQDLGVRTAQALIALKRGEKDTLVTLCNDLAADKGQLTETNYYMSAICGELSRHGEAKKFYQQAILTEPTNYVMYIEQANDALEFGKFYGYESDNGKRQLKVAKMLFETALEARPESYAALTGLALTYLFEENKEEALNYAQAAIEAGPRYAAGHYTLAAVLGSMRLYLEAEKEVQKGAELDRKLVGRTVPKGDEAWMYFSSAGRIPLITPPK